MNVRTAWMVLLGCALLLTGCWDRKEVNDIAFAIGSGTDITDNGYLYAVQFPLPSQTGAPNGGGGGTTGDKSWYIDSSEGQTISEAMENLRTALSRDLPFSHRQVMVIGEKLARAGFAPILDIASRHPENRLSMFVVVAEGAASDVLTANVPVEIAPAEMIRELTVMSMKTPRTLKHVIHAILTEGLDPAVPCYRTRRTRSGKHAQPIDTIERIGMAVFRDDKLAGFMLGKKGQGLLWAMGEVRDAVVTIPAPTGRGTLSLQFTRVDAEYEPERVDGQWGMHIKIRASGNMLENESHVPNNLEHFRQFEINAERTIKQIVAASLQDLQTKYKSDAVGLGDHLRRNHPRIWNEVRHNWRSTYSRMPIRVSVQVHMEHSGTIYKPMGVQEEELDY